MKKSLFLAFLVSSFLTVFSQAPAIQWAKNFGGTVTDKANAIQQTSDGGYIVAGETNSSNGDVTVNNGSTDYWVVKIDANGALQWQKSLGGLADDRANAVTQTTDGGYVVVGTTNSTNGDVTGNKGLYDFWVVKLTSTGTIAWQKCLGGTSIEEARAVQQTTDGGLIIVGDARSNNFDLTQNNGGKDFWAVKTNSVGTIVWQTSLGGIGNDIPYSVHQTSDGGYVLAGETNSIGGDVTGNNGGIDYWVVKLSSTGALSWQKCYGGSSTDKASSIKQTSDGGYIIAGTAASTNGNITLNNGLENPWVVKTFSTGTIQWQKCFGGPFFDAANSIQQTVDGGYIFAGAVSSNSIDVSGNNGGSDIWVTKLSTTGALTWQKCLGGTGSDIGTTVQQTTDNGYIVCGRSNSTNGDVTTNQGLEDFWVVKLNGTQTTTTTALYENNLSLANIHVYPNPSHGIISIKADNSAFLENGYSIKIINMLGKNVYETSLKKEESSIQLSELVAKGIYFLQLADSKDRVIGTQKIILE
jgi:hypothetical protein